MPLGKFFLMYFAAFSLCASSIKPLVDFSSSASNSIPSIRSSGSSVLPFDFDILLPSASRTMALI